MSRWARQRRRLLALASKLLSTLQDFLAGRGVAHWASRS
ncbi:hypothetical protein A2U01_0000324 [Trifolium medium]|uniref:Uncharacterized protein n=1 Tax=Trifolium medium TaxID=97028 RepID=A0A392LX90_9FABA|nr:hypothetical protein [Trifolium medium]